MTRLMLALLAVCLAPSASFAQCFGLEVVRTTSDSVWVKASPVFYACHYLPGDMYLVTVLRVTPCPAAFQAAPEEPPIGSCDPATQVWSSFFCDPLILGFECSKAYSMYMLESRCQMGGSCSYEWTCGYTFIPSVPGCEVEGPPLGACCVHYLHEGECFVGSAPACEYLPPWGGVYAGDGTVCQPTPPCVVPARRTSWGALKTIYR